MRQAIEFGSLADAPLSGNQGACGLGPFQQLSGKKADGISRPLNVVTLQRRPGERFRRVKVPVRGSKIGSYLAHRGHASNQPFESGVKQLRLVAGSSGWISEEAL